MSSIDQQEFRSALGAYATGVTVMTCVDAAGRAAAMTVNSFASLSLEPPLVLWSIDKASDQYAAFDEATHYAVNILAEDQEHLSNHFATPSMDKFSGIDHSFDDRGLPILPGCCATMACKIVHRYEGGDHIILVGEVLQLGKNEKAPLVFHGSQYRKLK